MASDYMNSLLLSGGASAGSIPVTNGLQTYTPQTFNNLDFGDGGGSTLGVSTTNAPANPYQQWGGQSAYNNLVSGFNTQKQGIIDSASSAAENKAKEYGLSVLNFLDSLKLGQQKLDRQGANNELAKMQGVNGVLGMVGRGIRSGGVMLNNKNAGDSSAAGALANAYGQIGRGQLSNVGNQYEQGNNELQADQSAFDVQQAAGVRNLQGSKDIAVNDIVNAARTSLVELDAKMADASMPERIAIEQEKNNIKQTVVSKLQALDQQLTSGVSGVKAATVDQRRQTAGDLLRAGTSLGADAFNFSTEAPATFQGIQPAGSGIPLYTMPRSRRTA